MSLIMPADAAQPGHWFQCRRYGRLLCTESASGQSAAKFMAIDHATGDKVVRDVDWDILSLPRCEGWDWDRRAEYWIDDHPEQRKVMTQEVLPGDPNIDQLVSACFSLHHYCCFSPDPLPEKFISHVEGIAAMLPRRPEKSSRIESNDTPLLEEEDDDE